MLLAYTRVVVDSIDVVSRLEATFICLMLHGRGIGGQVVTAMSVPFIPPRSNRHRARSWHRLADQLIYNARSEV
jgi:hypothetical protein